MSGVITAAVVVAVGAGVAAAVAADASSDAADTIAASGDRGIAEQRTQFKSFQESLAPYAQAGQNAFQRQQTLLGMNGQQAQKQAIAEIEGGARYQSLARQGENAILQNASATGGLRGGNTQAALANFRPQVLNQLIDKQYADLGGLASMGQASAAGVGAAGMQSANSTAGLMMAQGDARAQAQLQQAQLVGNVVNAGATALGTGVGSLGGNQQFGAQNPAVAQSVRGLNSDLGQPAGASANDMVDDLFS